MTRSVIFPINITYKRHLQPIRSYVLFFKVPKTKLSQKSQRGCEIPCGGCEDKDIAQTNINVRREDHTIFIRKKETKSLLVQHVMVTGHSNFDGTEAFANI